MKGMKSLWYSAGVSTAIFAESVFAKLPTAKESAGANSGDYILMGRETANAGIVLVTQILGAVILIGVVGALFKVYWEVTKQNKEWSDFLSTGIGGAVVGVIGMILLTMAETIVGATG
jgi:integrating conjugative element membrane protein (TIGR03745 family)